MTHHMTTLAQSWLHVLLTERSTFMMQVDQTILKSRLQ